MITLENSYRAMARTLLVSIGIGVSTVPGQSAEADRKPLASLPLTSFYPNPSAADGSAATLAFVSENRIAILLCSGTPRSQECGLRIVAVEERRLRVIANSYHPLLKGAYQGIFGLSDGRVLAMLRRGAAVFSADLSAVDPITGIIFPPSPGEDLIGEISGESWNVLRPGAMSCPVRKGRGELLSISNGLIAYRMNDVVEVINLSGKMLGSVPVPLQTKCSSKAEIVGLNKLFLDNCEKPSSFVTFHGRELLRLGRQDGWGFRHGWSRDRSRMLFDLYTRRVPASQRFTEVVTAVITAAAGLGAADENAVGESIKVVDTATGKTCFTWANPSGLLGSPGEFHGDINPSGQLVAIISRQSLDVYALPTTCETK